MTEGDVVGVALGVALTILPVVGNPVTANRLLFLPPSVYTTTEVTEEYNYIVVNYVIHVTAEIGRLTH